MLLNSLYSLLLSPENQHDLDPNIQKKGLILPSLDYNFELAYLIIILSKIFPPKLGLLHNQKLHIVSFGGMYNYCLIDGHYLVKRIPNLYKLLGKRKLKMLQ